MNQTILKIIISSAFSLSIFAQANDTTTNRQVTVPTQRPSQGVNILDDLSQDDAGLVRKKLEDEGKWQRPAGTLPKKDRKKIIARVSCDPEDGLFYMDIHAEDEEGEFYQPVPGNGDIPGIKNGRCLTSPGAIFPESSRTDLSIHGNRVSGTTKLHVTSERTNYPGIDMPNSVWVGTKAVHRKNDKGELIYDENNKPVFRYSGYATHATTVLSELGNPASHGCFRLNAACSRHMYNLVQQHGAQNTRVEFAGYKCGNKDLLTGKRSNVTDEEKAVSKKRSRKSKNLFEVLFGRKTTKKAKKSSRKFGNNLRNFFGFKRDNTPEGKAKRKARRARDRKARLKRQAEAEKYSR